nr:metallophosphoesterase [Clostridia bacterium]
FFSTDKLNTIAQLIDLSYAQFADLISEEPSFKTLIDLVLASGALSSFGNSISEIVDYFVSKYITASQAEGTGNELAMIIESLVTDYDPVEFGDSGYTYVYNGPVTVIPGETGVRTPYTTDFRLPSLIAMTYGADASSELSISWYTRYSVLGGDIEIYKADEEPEFTGVPTTAADFTIESTTEDSYRRDFGVDVGIFGILPYYTHLQRHIVKLTDLEPGAKYYYRLGDAEKGWWSDTGSFKADGGDAFTFFHMTDSQSQTWEQYSRAWASINAAAFDRYPDAAFLLHTGDFVDNTDVLRQWQWALDSAKETLMNLPVQIASGNHENFSSVSSTVQNFAIMQLRDTQDSTCGVSYSFDYANAHFMILNTEDLSDEGGLSVEQYNWLIEDAKNSDADWKIVAMHKSIYSNGDHIADDDVIALRSQLSALFYELDVDLVLSGHDHVYMRTDSMKNGLVSNGYDTTIISSDGSKYLAAVNPDGTFYSINGTAGVKSYETGEEYTEYFPQAAVAMAVTDPIFSAITIDGDQLVYSSYSMNTDTHALTKIDSFAIYKEEITALRGDVDNDGQITAFDARLALRHCLDDDTGVLKGRDFLAADADMDGVLTASDARDILRVAIGLDYFDPQYITMDSDKIGVTEKKPEPEPKEEPTTQTSIFESFTLPEGIDLIDIISLFVNS